MTAKEIKQKAMIIKYSPTFRGEGVNLYQGPPEGHTYYTFNLNEFNQFCEALCREQREIVKMNVDQEAIYCGEVAIMMRIENAPMPEL